MKSRITIEVDFDNGQPYIKILEQKNSDDVRDKLITFFRQRLGGESSWCYIGFYGDEHSDGITKWTIHPVMPDKIQEMIELAKARCPQIPIPETK